MSLLLILSTDLILSKKVGDIEMSFYKSAETYYKEMTSTITDADTSEHSFIYNALMPACYELSYQSMMLDEVTKRVFAKSALENGYNDDLIERCSEMGITQKLATYASGVIKVIGIKVSKFPSGSLVATSLGLTYITQSDVILNDAGIGYTTIIASEKGSKYNAEIGDVNSLPVKYEGILSITNEEKISNGYDDETYQALYDRYLVKVQTPSTSGNKYHYMNWALEVDGVGSARVYPLWSGNGTVKVVIANSNKRAASQELIQGVFNHIEEERPIGATVTVISVTEKPISVAANIQISSATTLGAVQNSFIAALESYFRDTFNGTKVSIMKIGSMLLDINGVLDVDYSSIKLNNTANNVVLGNDEIAVLGTVSLGVM